MRLLADIDVGRWFEDRGTLLVALIAALGAWGSWYGPRGARTSQREEWRRQTRLPAYLEFARSVEALEHAGRRHWRDMVGGSGEEPDDEPPTPEQLDKLVREVWRHLADVELVGPRVVAEPARELAQAATGFRAITTEAGAVTAAFESFRNEAAAALDLPA